MKRILEIAATAASVAVLALSIGSLKASADASTPVIAATDVASVGQMTVADGMTEQRTSAATACFDGINVSAIAVAAYE